MNDSPLANGTSTGCDDQDRALRASEVRYRRLFEAARDGILILDAGTGEITAVNPFLTDLLGYSEGEVLGKQLWELSPFEDTAKSKIAFHELQRQEYIRYDDIPLETRDGRKIDVEFVSNMYVSDDDHVIQCNIRDITERKRAASAQRESDVRYRTLFDYAPDGILIADPKGCYSDANPSMCRMLGYARNEMIGLSAADIVLPEEVVHVDEALTLIAGPTDYRREWKFRRKDGSVVSADVMATSMPDGNLLAVVRDATARNQAHDTLRATEELTRFALESANVGVWDMDYATGRNRWSTVMEAQYGLRPGEFAGTFDAFVASIDPRDQPAVLAVIGEAMKTGGHFTVAHRIVQPDGRVRWLTGTGHVVLDQAGHPARATGISQDVTERRTLEAQFQQAQKMEAVGQLAGGIAHDFNNLLTVILGFCALVRENTDPASQMHHDLGEIHNAGARAAELTRQLLAFSRRQIIEPTLLDLNLILSEMQPMLGRVIRENVTLLFGFGTNLRTVKADRGQLEQVIVNLAVNAQDAMPDGGELTIQAANVDLDASYAADHAGVRPGAYVVLTVIDSGTGMTMAVRERLFEPFFTTKEVGRGTGLGLAMVHGIVTRSGGSVDVDSVVGRGSTFRIYLPQATAKERVTPVSTKPIASRGGTETLLVVEDATGLRELTQRLLVRLGYAVIVAEDSAQAIHLFEENPTIALVLTDVVMPGLSGPQLAEQLLARRPALKVIYMSGYTDQVIVRQGVLNPGVAFIQKPFTAATLGQKIRDVLDAPAVGADGTVRLPS